jgi:integrase
MPRKLPLHVIAEKNRHGNVVFYYRVDKGPRTRLPHPDDPTFKACYQAAVSGSPIKKQSDDPRTLAWLVARYMESADWKELADGTRRQRGNIFHNMLKDENGNPTNTAKARFKDVTDDSISNGLEDRRSTPVQANNYLKAVVGLFKWAKKNNHVDIDPTVGVDRLKVKSDGFPAWDESDIRLFCAKWKIGTPQRLALEIAMHTGLRRSDLVKVGRQHLRQNELSIRTEKTGALITVELPQRVLDIIDATKTGDMHFLVTSFNKPFSNAGFGNWFGEAAREAGIEKNTHGVRKFAATTAANGGATAHELMSQFGWANSKQAEVYTKGADRARLGKKASRIVSEQLGNILSPHLEPGAGISAKSATKSKAEK